jgi:hypothetical protein
VPGYEAVAYFLLMLRGYIARAWSGLLNKIARR